MEKKIYGFLYDVEIKHWWFVGRRKYVNRLLQKYLPVKNTIELAEVGCGSGASLEMFSKYGTVDAMEMDEEALKRAKVRASGYVRRFEKGWLPENMQLNNTYDAVVALDVIEHIDDDVGSLKVLGDALKPDGKILLTVPAYQWMWSTHDDVNHHKRRYSRALLTRRLNDAGFNVLYISYFNALMFPLAVIIRMLQRISPSNEGVIDEYKMPSKIVNNILGWIFSLESYLAGWIQVPFGLSIAAVAEKK
jgi:SAM-dependent methyltransferase